MKTFVKIAIITIILPWFSISHVCAADDILHVSGKAVVFFGPTQSEYDSLTEDKQDEMNEILSDFYYYRNKVIPFLEINGIKEYFSTTLQINVSLSGGASRSYRRQNFKRTVGLIMSDGKNEPKIYLGIATDVDLIVIFKAYFDIN